MPALLGTRIPMAALVHAMAVAEHRSFTHAAAVLGITQSSVSMRVRALEDELGILLFERRARGVRLTDAGRRFIEEIAAGIGQLDYAIETAGALAQGDAGRLRIGLHASMPLAFLAELRRRFREGNPCIDVITIEGPPSDAIPNILDGSLDIVFVFGTVDTPECHSRQFWSEPMVIALPDSHPLAGNEALTWDELAGETFLIRHFSTTSQLYAHIVRRLAERGYTSQVRPALVERDTMMEMIADGEGITLTLTGAVPFPGVRLLSIADEPEAARFSGIWSPANRNPALEKFLALGNQLARSGIPNQASTGPQRLNCLDSPQRA
jgi:DNA-binding transcriptional LysR family regulator